MQQPVGWAGAPAAFTSLSAVNPARAGGRPPSVAIAVAGLAIDVAGLAIDVAGSGD
jgi:hypothetical protein